MEARKAVRAAGRWIGLAVLFLVVLEVCARIDDHVRWDAPMWGHYSQALLTVSDERGIHSRANAQFEKWKLNAFEFRGRELASEEKPAGVTRVAVLGASETFGLYESPGHEYPAQMGRMLNGGHVGRYEVLNAGCAGMTLPRFTHYFGVWIKRFEPDVVVIYPTPASYVSEQAPQLEVKPAGGPARELRDNLRIAGKAKIVLKSFIPARIQGWVRERQLSARIRGKPPGWVWEGPPAERVERFRADLRKLVRTVQATGAAVILATHANRFPADRAKWTALDTAQMMAWRESYPRASADCLLSMEDRGNEVVREVATELGTGLVDVAGAVPKDAAHFADFAHFTDEGARRVAAALAEAVRAVERAGRGGASSP